jgi:hypothetical protein
MKPCDDLKGLLKAQCIVKHNPGKGNKKDRLEKKIDEKVKLLSADCADKEGNAKVACMRRNEKKAVKAVIKKAVKHEIKRTIRGKKLEASSSSESSED